MPEQVKANRPQGQFLAMPEKFKAFVAGFGTGKTWVLGMGLCIHFCQWPRISAGYFAPTYPQIRDIFYPTIDEIAYGFGFRTDINESNKEVHFFRGKKFWGTTICRSMERPDTIVGFKIGHALVDELDVMKMDKAELAWRKIIARMRYNIDGLRNGIDVGTTPEGFKFTYKKFVTERTSSYGLINASTYENEKNLPADYIPSLIETYPSNVIDAYINGIFCNLTTGTVYIAFDRKKHNTDQIMSDNEPLFIGQDFNVGNMCSCVYVKRGKEYHAVDQLQGIYDTPALIKTIKSKYANHDIILYPDASGASRKTVNASTSDISLLREAGFTVRAHNSNPIVKDRILSVNKAFENGLLKINCDKCPDIAGALEKQAYDKNGEPDKTSGHDHFCDAAGYPIAYDLPVVKKSFFTSMSMGH